MMIGICKSLYNFLTFCWLYSGPSGFSCPVSPSARPYAAASPHSPSPGLAELDTGRVSWSLRPSYSTSRRRSVGSAGCSSRFHLQGLQCAGWSGSFDSCGSRLSCSGCYCACTRESGQLTPLRSYPVRQTGESRPLR